MTHFQALSARVMALLAVFIVCVATVAVALPLATESAPTAEAQQDPPNNEDLDPWKKPASGTCGTSTAVVIDSSYNGWYQYLHFGPAEYPQIFTQMLQPGLESLLQLDPSANVGIYTYDTVSPAESAKAGNLSETPIADPNNPGQLNPTVLNRLKDNGRRADIASHNMHAGLLAVLEDVNKGARYDQVMVLSEWGPTAMLNPDGTVNDGNRVYGVGQQELDATKGVIRQLAAKGVQVIPVGFGTQFDPNSKGTSVPGNYEQNPKDANPLKGDSYGFKIFQPDGSAPYYLTGPNLLKELTSASISPNNYYGVWVPNNPEILTTNTGRKGQKLSITDFLSPCLSASLNVVDKDQKLLERVTGRDVEIVPDPAKSYKATVTTNAADGFARESVPSLQPTSQATMTYTLNEPLEMHADVQCFAQYPGWGAWLEVGDEKVTQEGNKLTVSFTRELDWAYHCSFMLRETTQLSVTKLVQANEAVNNEVGAEAYGQFHFAYRCEDTSAPYSQDEPFTLEGTISPAFAEGSQLAGDYEGDVALPHTIDKRIPVGASCTVTEVEPRTRSGYFSSATNWELNGKQVPGEISSTVPDGGYQWFVDKQLQPYSPQNADKNPQTTFEAQPAQRGGNIALKATNVYDSPQVTQKVNVTVDNAEVFRGGSTDLAPKSVWVNYRCRYIPNAANRPEASENPDQFPVFIPSGGENPIEVPLAESNGTLSGSVTLGSFPVGTQCLYEVTGKPSADGSSAEPIAKGFTLAKPQWSSQACMKNNDPNLGDTSLGYTETPRECPANYSYAYPELNQNGEDLTMAADLTFRRNLRQVDVYKELAGQAGAEFDGRDFPVTVTCTQAGDNTWQLFGPKDFVINSAKPLEVADVPVESECHIEEKMPEGFDSESYEFTLPDPVTVAVPAPEAVAASAAAPVEATVKNTIEDNYGQLTLNYEVNTDNVDVSNPNDLTAVDGTVTAMCTLPDGENLTLNKTMSHGDFWEVLPEEGYSQRYDATQGLPVGTKCAIGVTTTEDLEALNVEQKPGTTLQYAEYTVREGANDLSVQLVLDEPAKVLEVAFSRAPLQAPDAATYMPREYTVDYMCIPNDGSAPNVGQETVYASAADGPQSIFVDNVRGGENCTVTVEEGSADKPYTDVFSREVLFTAGPPSNKEETITAGGPASFDLTIGPGNQSELIQAQFTYRPILAELNVSKALNVTQDGQPLSPDDPVYRAVFKDPTFRSSVVCTRNEKMLLQTAVQFGPAAPAILKVPAGSECTLTETPRTTVSTGAPEVSVDVEGTTTQGNEATLQVGTGTGATAPAVTVTNSYDVKTGSLHVKKKVDGTGVATVSGDKQFPVAWTCTLNGVEVSRGEFSMGRFTSAVDRAIEEIPLGAACRLSEDPAKVKDPESIDPNNQGDAYYSKWSTRWAVDESETGFETEKRCTDVDECAVLPDTPNSAEYSILSPGFNYTAILWNTYDYLTVPVGVSKFLDEAQGQKLAQNTDLAPASGTLRCTHPSFAGLAPDHPFIADPTRTATVKFPQGGGQGALTYASQSATGGSSQVTSETMSVPANFVCTFVEDEPQTQFSVAGANGTRIAVGSTVDTSFATETVNNGAAPQPGTTPSPIEGKRGATFTVDSELVRDNTALAGDAAGDRQTLMVTNAYTLDTASITAEFHTQRVGAGDVSEWLPNTLKPTVRCTDPLLGIREEKTLELDEGAAATTVGDYTVGTSCEVTSHAEDLIGDQSFINVGGLAVHTRGNEYEALISRVPVTTDLHVQPLRPGSDRVILAPTYTVLQVAPAVSKTFTGYKASEVVTDADSFDFNYECTFDNLVDGQPEPFAPRGTFSMSQLAGNWAAPSTMPQGSECVITEQAPPKDVQDRLDAENLRMTPYYTTLSDGGEEFIHALGADGVTLNEDMPLAAITNGIYRNDAEVQVQKVQADLTTALGGAEFSIYHAAEDGSVGEKVSDMTTVAGTAGEVSNTFTTRLEPGTYFLVETKAGEGASLLPGAWKFTVAAANDPSFADLQISIKGLTENSGLITLVDAEPEANKPAIIQVANVAQGKLPLTGSRALVLWLGAGLALAAAALWLRKRKN
ncbi:DUF5979 domain-containing protein [Corynebacterium sp.]|uniref:DUF5979 domain-containing protein n=1 Tax=Corynebacterium sp. TaxID=1720 RepID=UPI0026DD6787|nr:DUF5979 domain-containing protein [Corynebacterium sp.]MDO5032344.1 DUF5979 domain-containing protein [Corynebacterium sp.]